MGKLETSGYKKFWPMRQFTGMNPDGSKNSIEVFRDMVSGEVHTHEDGWNGSPPDLPSGERDPIISSSKFAENYVKIFGHE
jgi:hypothetical protein